MTARPAARPGPLGHGEQDGERAVRRFVTVLAVTVGGLCFLFSLGNVYQLAVDLELWVWIRPLVAPAVDLSLVALVVGIRFLARRGVSGAELRRPRLFMLAVGLAAWALNTAHAVAERDWGKAAFDSLAPGLLIGWAEVLPWFLRQFQAVTHPAGADSRPPVPIPTAPPPADDNTPILGAGSDGVVPAVPLPAAASVAVAVPPGSGNGHRPRAVSTSGGEEPAADVSMRAHWAAERAAGRTPSGAELDRVCGRDPRNGAGRKARARYLREEATGRFHAPQPVPVPASDPAAAGSSPIPAADPVRPGPVPADSGHPGPASAASPVQAGTAADEARELLDEKRLEMRRGTWRGRQRGRLPFNHWADEWWSDWSADPHRSPNTLVMAESRLRNHVRPFFGDRPIERIGPADVRRWQAQLDGRVGYDTVTQCRSLVRRIFEYATDEGAIEANPVRKVPPPKRRADPEIVFAEVKRRRALTPEEAGRLLACFLLFWWDHVTTLLGTGLRFGELAGLRRRRVHLTRSVPILEVGPTRYQAGRFGSGFKPRPKSDASIRPVPLAPLVVEAIRRQLPSGSDPEALVFTGPGGGSAVSRGARTVLSRHNFWRTYQAAVAKLADPVTDLRPTAIRTLKALRVDSGQTAEQLAARLAKKGRAVRLATTQRALDELAAAGLVASAGELPSCRWSPLPASRDPLLDTVDLHGSHDFRHTFATWLEDDGIPARVIDELMGHEATGRGGQGLGSAMGAHYRHTTPEMAARVVAAVDARLAIVLRAAEEALENRRKRSAPRMF